LPEFSRATKRSVTATLFTFDWLGTRSLTLSGERAQSQQHAHHHTNRAQDELAVRSAWAFGCGACSDEFRPPVTSSFCGRRQQRISWAKHFSVVTHQGQGAKNREQVSGEPATLLCMSNAPRASPLLALRRNTAAHPTGVCGHVRSNRTTWGFVGRRTSSSLSHGPQQPHPCHLHPRSITM
jgi:hypothetical protein